MPLRWCGVLVVRVLKSLISYLDAVNIIAGNFSRGRVSPQQSRAPSTSGGSSAPFAGVTRLFQTPGMAGRIALAPRRVLTWRVSGTGMGSIYAALTACYVSRQVVGGAVVFGSCAAPFFLGPCESIYDPYVKPVSSQWMPRKSAALGTNGRFLVASRSGAGIAPKIGQVP